MPFDDIRSDRGGDAWNAGRIAAMYAVASAAWILLSDRVLKLLLPDEFDPDAYTLLQTFKGLAFVGMTTPLLWAVVVRRIRQVRHVQDEARLTRDRLLRFAENMPGTFAIKDARGRLIFLRGTTAGGFVLQDLIGKTAHDFLDPATADRLTTHDREVLQAGKPTQYVEPIPLADGLHHFLMNRFPLAGPDGEPLLGSITLDVTERQEAEARIRDLARELEQANRLKDQFLSNLSHELRTPITSIRLWTEVLQSAPEDVAAVREAAEMIHHSALAQSRLIEDLLDITRVIAGKLKVEPRPISLGDVVKETLDLLAPMAAEREVRVEAAVPPGRHPVLGDARRLQQVAWNLVTNAIKFSRPGTVVRLTVAPDPGAGAGGGWALSVADEGMGIPPDLLPKLFERFRQQDSSKTRAEGGLGIGLSIVKYLVEAHGGTVTAESPGVGKGATFTVRLPATAEPVPEPQAPPTPPAGVVATATAAGVVAVGHELDGVRILLVEDNADSRNGLSLLLRKSGATVHAAETADAAEALAASAEIDVLLSDIGLPERDGCDLVRELRGRPGWAGKPAIAISAYALPEDRDRALRCGFDAFVVKPIDTDRLLVMIGEWMDRKRGAGAKEPVAAAT